MSEFGCFELNKIYLSDCCEAIKRMPDESVDLTVTSPPYDNLRTYGNQENDWCMKKFYGLAKDIYRVTKSGGIVVWIVNDETVNGSETGTSFQQALYFREIGFCLHDTMIWKKICPYTHPNRYIQDFEYMFIFSKGKPKTANLICDRKNKWGGIAVHGTERLKTGETKQFSMIQKAKTIKEYGARYNIWDIPGEKNNRYGHPAPFPKKIAIDHILTWSNEGDIVLDPFIGSGTTAVACKNLGRNFIGFEINPKWHKIACDRLQNQDASGQLSLFTM